MFCFLLFLYVFFLRISISGLSLGREAVDRGSGITSQDGVSVNGSGVRVGPTLHGSESEQAARSSSAARRPADAVARASLSKKQTNSSMVDRKTPLFFVDGAVDAATRGNPNVARFLRRFVGHQDDPLMASFAGSKPLARCAVVGNSAALLNSTCGADVDAHDFVFRIRYPPLDGFTEDAGTRTDAMWALPKQMFAKLAELDAKALRAAAAATALGNLAMPVDADALAAAEAAARFRPKRILLASDAFRLMRFADRYQTILSDLGDAGYDETTPAVLLSPEWFAAIHQELTRATALDGPACARLIPPDSPMPPLLAAVMTASLMCKSTTVYGVERPFCPHWHRYWHKSVAPGSPAEFDGSGGAEPWADDSDGGAGGGGGSGELSAVVGRLLSKLVNRDLSPQLEALNPGAVRIHRGACLAEDHTSAVSADLASKMTKAAQHRWSQAQLVCSPASRFAPGASASPLVSSWPKAGANNETEPVDVDRKSGDSAAVHRGLDTRFIDESLRDTKAVRHAFLDEALQRYAELGRAAGGAAAVRLQLEQEHRMLTGSPDGGGGDAGRQKALDKAAKQKQKEKEKAKAAKQKQKEKEKAAKQKQKAKDKAKGGKGKGKRDNGKVSKRQSVAGLTERLGQLPGKRAVSDLVSDKVVGDPFVEISSGWQRDWLALPDNEQLRSHLFQEYDVDADGAVSLSEFVVIWGVRAQARTRLRALFRLFDDNPSDQLLNEDEYRLIQQCRGLGAFARWDDVLADVDHDDNRLLDMAEFFCAELRVFARSRQHALAQLALPGPDDALDCQVSAWTDWSPCASDRCDSLLANYKGKTGQPSGDQTRSRMILVSPDDGGAPCGPLIETRECQLSASAVANLTAVCGHPSPTTGGHAGVGESGVGAGDVQPPSACPPGSLGCPCHDNAFHRCERNLQCSLCHECAASAATLAMAEADHRAPSLELRCQHQTGCPLGTLGCPCAAGRQCNEGLLCTLGCTDCAPLVIYECQEIEKGVIGEEDNDSSEKGAGEQQSDSEAAVGTEPSEGEKHTQTVENETQIKTAAAECSKLGSSAECVATGGVCRWSKKKKQCRAASAGPADDPVKVSPSSSPAGQLLTASPPDARPAATSGGLGRPSGRPVGVAQLMADGVVRGWACLPHNEYILTVNFLFDNDDVGKASPALHVLADEGDPVALSVLMPPDAPPTLAGLAARQACRCDEGGPCAHGFAVERALLPSALPGGKPNDAFYMKALVESPTDPQGAGSAIVLGRVLLAAIPPTPAPEPLPTRASPTPRPPTPSPTRAVTGTAPIAKNDGGKNPKALKEGASPEENVFGANNNMAEKMAANKIYEQRGNKSLVL